MTKNISKEVWRIISHRHGDTEISNKKKKKKKPLALELGLVYQKRRAEVLLQVRSWPADSSDDAV